ncbi:MAG: phage terminase large subunit family protein [Planctomycetaceae bacterium]|nr:phage terminase large subunit family protein [Planctomycetaceae bacterium]
MSDWTQRYRILPKDGSSAPGPWRNDRTPYLVEIMDALSVSSPATEVVFAKGSQIGATEAALNWILYLIDYVGGPILALQPTDDNASEWSKQRIAPSMELCERIKGKLRPVKSRDSDNTILEKGFLGGRLFLSGVNSPNALASKPIGNIYGDEIDRWPGNVGGNGDPVEQVKRRMATYKRGKRFFTSSPVLISDSRIWKLYMDSDQRVYEVPCPLCGHYQEIAFDKLVYDRADPDAVHMVCEQCTGVIEEYHKTEMLARGKWHAKNPGHWRVGFHLSALYSPLGWLSWAEVVRTYIEAEGDVVKMQVFVNTILGLPWAEDSEAIADGYLKRRVETYKAQVPMGVLVLTMAVDVQSNRLEYEVVGWGEGEESWGIEYGVIHGDPTELDSGDPSNPSVWQQLDALRKRDFQHEDGGVIKVSCTLVDSGGNCTDTVYAYTKPLWKERVYSVKGSGFHGKPLLNRATKGGKIGATLFVLGVDKGKDLVFSRLKTDEPGPGYCHFPDDENRGYDAQFYAGLISERRKSKIKGGQRITVWEKPDKARNEPFDIRVYSTAAIRIFNPVWERLRANRKTAGGRPWTSSASPSAQMAKPAGAVVVDNSTMGTQVVDGIQLFPL